MFRFTDDCVLGVEEIDAEHKHLFDLLNDAVYLMENEYIEDMYSEISELLQELEKYADEHFIHEEAYMQKIRDPELILQRAQHMAFREKITEFFMMNIDDETEQRNALENIINFLARWLYQHIIGSDTMIGKLPPLEEWMLRENPCEFTDEYLTGIDMIDREHRQLFEIIERASHLVRSWSTTDHFDEILHTLDELRKYTQNHFSDEEEYMRNIHYDGYDAQKRAHEAFISRLDELDPAEIEKNPRDYLESLVEFLLGWLIHHILQSDKKISKGKA